MKSAEQGKAKQSWRKRQVKLNSNNIFKMSYSTGSSQRNTDFAKMNQNEVVQIRTNFFEDFRIHKLIREAEFAILNL